MKFLSVCSGIEAASVAWNPLGWKAAAFSEIEPFPCSVLAHHYPDTPNRGDMTKFKDWPDDSIDLLCGGTPCQSFSVAGLRKGLDDPRGNLMLTYGAIAAKYRPRWMVWENVPGVLSSNGGRDFGSFLWLLGQLGYGFAYRVLDAQYFGVAQRRRRVFVVGCLGDWRSAAAVLFERHSLQGHPAPRRETGKAAPTIPSRSLGGGGLGTDFDCDGGLIVRSVALRGREGGGTAELGDEVQNCLRASSGGGDKPHVLCLAHGQGGAEVASERSPTLTCNHEAPIVVHGTQDPCVSTDAAFALGLNNGGENVLAFDTTQITSAENRSNPQHGDPCHPLSAGAHPPAIAQVVGAMSASGSTERKHGFGWGQQDWENGYAQPHGAKVRRLTPRECERLQGFPDGYTQVPHRGKPAADGPRYKALGNSWAVPCARWIGERIAAVDALRIEKREAA